MQCRVVIPGRIKELTVFEAVEDGGKDHASDSDDSAFMPTTALDLLITFSVVREVLIFQRGEGALNQQRLEINASPTDAN